MAAAAKSDVVRGFVRLHKTPPTKVVVKQSQEEQVCVCECVCVCVCVSPSVCVSHLAWAEKSAQGPQAERQCVCVCVCVCDLSQARLLLSLLLARHWELHGQALKDCIANTGGAQLAFKAQVSLVTHITYVLYDPTGPKGLGACTHLHANTGGAKLAFQAQVRTHTHIACTLISIVLRWSTQAGHRTHAEGSGTHGDTQTLYALHPA